MRNMVKRSNFELGREDRKYCSHILNNHGRLIGNMERRSQAAQLQETKKYT